jgi:DNA-binding CsgD family transcriptional regulator
MSRGGRKPTTAEMVLAAYDLSGDLCTWFAGAVSQFRAHLDDGHGAFGAIASREPAETLHLHLDGAHPLNRALVRIGPSIGFHQRLPQGFAASTASRVLGVTRHAKAMAPFLPALIGADHCGLTGPDGAGLELVIVAPRKEIGVVRPFDHHLARRVLPHFAVALRLRRSLTGLALDSDCAEAVFDPEGRCVNAQGMAEPVDARELLRAAIVEIERRRRPSTQETSEPRDALLAGRWSLVDRFEKDGRRYVVAYRNPPGVLDPRRLSPAERDVAARIAQGTSQSAVAAELGISPSTVASIANSVMKKLGLRSTRELPLFWRDAAGYPVALGRGDLVGLCSAGVPPAPGLTPAEREVLAGVIEGRSNRDIAEQRGASLRTVANQVAALLKKYRASSRVDLSTKSLDPTE